MNNKHVFIICKVLVLSVFCIFVNIQSTSANNDALSEECLSFQNFSSDFGNPIDTYEDVDSITNIGYPSPLTVPSTDENPVIHQNMLNAYKHGTKKDEGNEFQDFISDPNGKALYNHYSNFIKKYFFIEGPYWAANPAPSAAAINGNPSLMDTYKNNLPSVDKHCKHGASLDFTLTQSPAVVKYVLYLDHGWKYIPSSFPHIGVDACSCDSNHNLCDYDDDTPPGPCKRAATELCPMDPAICECGCDHDIDAEHIQTDNNIFANLGDYIESKIEIANIFPNVPPINTIQSLDENTGLVVNTNVEFVMRFKDRTPPRISGCTTGGDFPDLGNPIPATTGDWHKVEGLTIEDNSGCVVSMCLVLGKIDSFPSSNWAQSENWFPENVQTSLDPQYLILPNTCHGAMHYSVFAWDKNNNMNPGEPLIVEDDPENCYGLRNPPINFENLGTSPVSGAAKAWPIKFEQLDALDINDNNIQGSMRRGQGVIRIKDNDLPNIVIRLESAKDNSKIFFPPLTKANELPIYDSTHYSGIRTNSEEYVHFIGGATTNSFTSNLIANPDKEAGFRIIDVDTSSLSVISTTEQNMVGGFKNYIPAVYLPPPAQSTPEKLTSFVANHFRLENYITSDTDGNGDIIESEASSYGLRNSYGESITAILLEPLREDVEYKISVWADDNVKYSTVDKAGIVLTNIISIPSGIDNGSIKVEVNNQFPSFSATESMDKNSSVSNEIKVVFREPTSGSFGSLADLATNKYPYIEVSVTDFSGLTRKIKLHFKVSDMKPKIRVLEHKHETN